MTTTPIGEIVIDANTTEQFSRLSGDFNPLHIDPILARRYQFGTTVVHGVCATLKAIDLYIAMVGGSHSLVTLEVLYSKPVRHGDAVQVSRKDADDQLVVLELSCAGVRVQQIKFRLQREDHAEFTPQADNRPLTGSEDPPRHIRITDAADLAGQTTLFWDRALCDRLFPSLSANLPAHQLSLVLGTTRIVGMQCPGLNSVFGSFNLIFRATDGCKSEVLDYSVSQVDERFSRIIITLDHPCATGEIEAFFRPEPITQCTFSSVTAMVDSKQFSSQAALVIGGSRGLGEIAAKIIAAGGGEVYLGYASGFDDAQAIADDICRHGGQCNTVHIDVLNQAESINELVSHSQITHIYYFASPLIEKNTTSLWNPALFDRFCKFYLTGLAHLLQQFTALADYRRAPVTLFIPSTEFLDEPVPGFGEYIAAKAAMEAMARQFATKFSSWKVFSPRLPRLATDQTAGVAQGQAEHTARTILQFLTTLD